MYKQDLAFNFLQGLICQQKFTSTKVSVKNYSEMQLVE